MNINSFAEDDFNPKDWINKAWSSAPSSDDKELFVSNTVTKLQLYMKQLTNGLDETTAQIVRGVPRALQEAEVLRRDGSALRERLIELERRAGGVEADTGHSIDSLRRIDKLKSSLQVACMALREADKWAQLASSLEEVLEGGVPTRGEPLAELTKQVAAMTASLEVLSEAPDYESKRVQLEVLYNRLEAALSPAIVEALTQRNAESARAHGAMVAAMGRGAAGVRYWRRVEAAQLEAAWRRRHDAGAARDLPRDLHADLLTHAHSQMDWLTNVIRTPTPLTELVRLYSELLTGLEPLPAKLASIALRQCTAAADGLNLLTDLRATAVHFMKSLGAMLENGKEAVPASAVSELGRAVCAPLRDSLPIYTDLQTAALTDRLATVDCQQEDPLDRARSLQLCVERSATWVKGAHATGLKIAGVACYPYLLPALEALFAELCSRLSSNLRLLDAELGADRDASRVWRLLPAALALATAAGALRDHVVETERAMTQCLSETSEVDPLDDVEWFLLEDAGREQLGRLRGRSAALAGAAEDAGRVCRSLAALVLSVVCSPPARQLDKIPDLGVWNDNDQLAADLPDFSLAPQEYITQVGQYLMTLPQHLEAYLAERPAGLVSALAPHQPDVDIAVYLLNEVCSQTCDLYSEKVFSVRNMDALGAKRCATDIAYLCSVVDELGGTVPPALRTLERSLRTARAALD